MLFANMCRDAGSSNSFFGSLLISCGNGLNTLRVLPIIVVLGFIENSLSAKLKTYVGISGALSNSSFEIRPKTDADVSNAKILLNLGETKDNDENITIDFSSYEDVKDKITNFATDGYDPFGDTDLQSYDLSLSFGVDLLLRNNRKIFLEGRVGIDFLSDKFIGGRKGKKLVIKNEADTDNNKIKQKIVDGGLIKSLSVSKSFNVNAGGGIVVLKHGNVSLFGSGYLVLEHLKFFNRSGYNGLDTEAKISSHWRFGLLTEVGTRVVVNRNIEAVIAFQYTFGFSASLPTTLKNYQNQKVLYVKQEVKTEGSEESKTLGILTFDKEIEEKSISANYNKNTLGIRVGVHLYL